jgi:hypothetical protein
MPDEVPNVHATMRVLTYPNNLLVSEVAAKAKETPRGLFIDIMRDMIFTKNFN